jgi:sec-independent protein translocase protein TatB
MSFSHLLILGIIAVIVIPPEKLPEVARQVARFLGELRRMSSGIFDDLQKDPGPQLKPEDNLKRYEQQAQAQAQNSGLAPQGTQPGPLPDEPGPTPEEIKKAEEAYQKYIQSEAASTQSASVVTANPDEQKKPKDE